MPGQKAPEEDRRKDRLLAAFRAIGDTVAGAGATTRRRGFRDPEDFTTTMPDGVAAVAVSLVHGCALQAVIDPTAFSVQQHFDTAARMLDGFRDNAGAL